MASCTLIGVDDTDVLGSRGTGKLARLLAEHLDALGIGVSTGVTRHQLLVHPDIPYTSHNSAACIRLETHLESAVVFDVCKQFIRESFIRGSDPGLCIGRRLHPQSEATQFGRRAQAKVLEIGEACDVAERCGLLLEALEGTGQGVIGAVAALGLRASGHDGRFLDLPGLRNIAGTISVGEIKALTPIALICTHEQVELPDEAQVDTQGWLRPRLVDQRPVLVVQPHRNKRGVWISIDRRENKGPHQHRS